MLEELVPAARRDGTELVAEYRGGTGAGTARVAHAADVVWVIGAEGETAATLRGGPAG